MKVTQTNLGGVVVVEPDVYGDERGYFMESWAQQRYASLGIPETFVQDNLSKSRGGVVRGLHLQHPYGQGKLVMALLGEVFDVAVDVRVGSPTFGQWFGCTLSQQNHRQMYIPPGFAHGFAVLSEEALFAYKCTQAYHKETELGVRWNDPDLGIRWPLDEPVLSTKDSEYPRLAEISAEKLPRFEERR